METRDTLFKLLYISRLSYTSVTVDGEPNLAMSFLLTDPQQDSPFLRPVAAKLILELSLIEIIGSS